MGPAGVHLSQRFEIEVTPLLRPGAENLIAVRGEDSTGTGGLWRSVLLVAEERP